MTRTFRPLVAAALAAAAIVVPVAPAGAGKYVSIDWNASPLSGTAGTLVTVNASADLTPGNFVCDAPVRIQLWDATDTNMLTDNGTGDGVPGGDWAVALDIDPAVVPNPGTYSLRLLCQGDPNVYYADKVFTLNAPATTTTTTVSPTSAAPTTTAAVSGVTAQPTFTG